MKNIKTLFILEIILLITKKYKSNKILSFYPNGTILNYKTNTHCKHLFVPISGIMKDMCYYGFV